MKPKIVRIGRMNINYYESTGPGPAAVLVHGNSMSALSFQPQIKSALRKKYRIIAIDLPGHGRSTPAIEPDTVYSLPGYADILCGVVEELKLNDAVFVGSSLGGHIVLEASSRLSSAKGFMIYGAPPVSFPPAMEEAFLPNPAVALAFKGDLTADEIKTLAGNWLSPATERIPDLFLSDINNTDRLAREKIMESIGLGNYTDELKIVKGLKRPIAVLHGENEAVVNGAYLSTLDIPMLWRKKVQIIKGAGHLPHWDCPESFNTLLGDFLEDCNE